VRAHGGPPGGGCRQTAPQHSARSSPHDHSDRVVTRLDQGLRSVQLAASQMPAREWPLPAGAAGCNDADVAASRDPIELLVRANEEFARRLRLVGPEDWRRSTPCSAWDVRALVNHVVGANVRYQLLLNGAPVEQVEAMRTVDHLGDNVVASFVVTAVGVVACFREQGALERIAHHATGDRTGRELLSMRILDVAIHGWDLAHAIGADENLDDDVVAFLLGYVADLDLGSRQRAFALADAEVPRNASPRDRLLHQLGRRPDITQEVR
jgi:uncharacterized protein (TIGR03086 family)